MSHPVLLDLAERQYGLVGRQQLRAAGVPRSVVERLGSTPDWEMLTSRVARRTGIGRSTGQALLAAALDAGGDASVSHLPAAAWWGLPSCAVRPIHLTTTRRSRRKSSLSRVHVVTLLPASWTTCLRGVPVVRPELLALQLFAVCRPERAETLVDRLWSLRVLSGPSIAAFLAQMGERGRNGTAGLRRYLDARGPRYVPPASNLESRVKRILADAGISMRRQVDSGGERWTGRVDFRHASAPVILEVQSEAYHTALVDRRADDLRRSSLELAGFIVVEAWDSEVWASPRNVVSRVDAALRQLGH